MIKKIKATYDVMYGCRLSGAKKSALINKRLKKLLISSYKHVPYYRDVMKKIGYDPAKDYKGPEDLQKFPVTTKKDLRSNDISMFLREGSQRENLYFESTSGSTGIPLKVYFSEYEKAFLTAKWLRVLFLNGYSIRDKYFSIVSTMGKNMSKSIIQKLGFFRKKSVLYSNTPEHIADLFLDYKPQVLWGSRAYIEILIAELIKRKKAVKDLKLLMSGAEIITKNNRRMAKNILGIDLTEIYGSVETGVAAYETPKRDGLHLIDDSIYFEFLDDNKEPVRNSGIGHIIVTNLISLTMPFIRYDLGDLAVIKIIGHKDGREIRSIAKISGRDNDYIGLPTGRKLYMHDFDNIAFGFEGIIQFRIIQKSKTHIELIIAAAPEYFLQIKNRVLQELAKIFPASFTFELVRVDSITPDASGKFRMMVSEL